MNITELTNIFRYGDYEFTVTVDTIMHLISRAAKKGKAIIDGELLAVNKQAFEIIKADPEMRRAYAEFLTKFDETVNAWKHETPHLRYACDRGSLAVRLNGVRLLVGNVGGDGDYPVYILRGGEDVPMTFSSSCVGPWLVEGPAKVEVLDYDCDGANVMATFDLADGEQLKFLHDAHGAIALVVSTMK